MKLKVGDIVEFKKYEDLGFEEVVLFSKDEFPKSGKVEKVIVHNEKVMYFLIEGIPYNFSVKSVARVISDVDINSLKPGDEVLVKATVKTVFDGFIRIKASVDKTDVTKILKRKEPEHFIVKEDYYGMYIGAARKLVSDNTEAKIYTSRITANEDAADMCLNAWDVIPYDD